MESVHPSKEVKSVDDEEDDLDDLDELLDEFTLKSPEPTPATATKSAVESANSTTEKSFDAGELAEDEFAKQLELGIEQILSDLEQNPESRKQFEDLMKGISDFTDLNAAETPTTSTGSGPASIPKGQTPGKKADTLQETIARTMERMKESGQRVEKEITTTSEEDEFLAAMMRQLEQSSGASGTGDQSLGSDEDLSKMLAGMMEQLTSKEILYEPMKELDDKYADWLQKNRASLNPEDAARYDTQRVVVREIVVRFENPSYSDHNESDRKYIVERMQKMQESGSPPPDIMGELGPGAMGLDNSLGGLGPEMENCNIQ
ncbi:Pex19 protein [Lipomyces chichibuensis]|uniref:Pex19 protein n=1 Tax=Lipomyces chichibuensis TaxID=1546026 RepID=UPI003343BD1D